MPGTARSARALGLFSLGLGAAEILMPRAVAGAAGIRTDARGNLVTRLLGLRELGAGVGLLTQQPASPWLWARVAGDALDLTLLASATRDAHHRHMNAAAALATVGSVALLDLAAAQQASDDAERAAGQQLVKAITIRRDPPAVYQFWRDFRSFPGFMSHLESVAVLDDRHSHWTARGPAGSHVEWDAEIITDRPNELIAWRSLPGAAVSHSGQVRFTPAPGDRGTEVRVQMHYTVPGGTLGSAVARLFGQEPQQQVLADLRKVKQVLETGEVLRSAATIDGTDLFQGPGQPLPARQSVEARA